MDGSAFEGVKVGCKEVRDGAGEQPDSLQRKINRRDWSKEKDLGD